MKYIHKGFIVTIDLPNTQDFDFRDLGKFTLERNALKLSGKMFYEHIGPFGVSFATTPTDLEQREINTAFPSLNSTIEGFYNDLTLEINRSTPALNKFTNQINTPK